MAIDHPFKKSAFHNVEYAVVFYNTTSRTEMSSDKKSKINELGEDWMSLEVPKTSCTLNHKLLIHIISKRDVKKLTRGQLRNPVSFAISIAGQVSEYHNVSDQISFIKVSFTQYSKAEWEDFIGTWKKVQDGVDKQFKEMKE